MATITDNRHITNLSGIMTEEPDEFEGLVYEHPFFEGKMIDDVVLINSGFNHLVFKVITNKGSFVARLHPDQPTNITEIKVQNAIAALGYAPKVLEFDKKISIITYVQGDSYSARSWPPRDYKQFAKQLAAIHQVQLPFDLPTLDLNRQIEQYRCQVNLAPDDEIWVSDILEQLKALSNYPQTLGLCHNDLNRYNMLNHKCNHWIIDWEYAAIGDVFFDLAGFTIEHNVREENIQILLNAYFEQQKELLTTPFDLNAKLALMKKAYEVICWLWHEVRIQTR